MQAVPNLVLFKPGQWKLELDSQIAASSESRSSLGYVEQTVSAYCDRVRDYSGICELADISGGNTEVAGDVPDAHVSEWRIFGHICTAAGYFPRYSVDYST